VKDAPAMRPLARPSPRWPQTGKLPPTTHEELVDVLVRAGGRVLVSQAHGVIVAIHKHLVFVSATFWVAEAALADALRAARLTPERFLELRASPH
jgi:hypothetical protein